MTVPAARTEQSYQNQHPAAKPGGKQTRFSTVPEVAAALRVSNMTVYRLIQAEAIPAYRIGRSIRVPTVAVWDYLEGARIDGSDLSQVKAL